MTYVFGDFVLDTTREELTRHGASVPLEPKAYRMLVYLIENRGRLVGKGELLKNVWPGVNVDETAVRRCIRAIRQALGESRVEEGSIETRHGRGYRFLAAVAAENSVLSPQVPISGETPISPEPKAEGEPEGRNSHSRSVVDTAISLSERISEQSPRTRLGFEGGGSKVFFNPKFGVALLLKENSDHAKAIRIAKSFQSKNTGFVTTRAVLLEVADIISDVLGQEAAAEFLLSSEHDPNLEVISITDELYLEAKEFAERHDDSGPEASDVITRFILKHRGISEAMPAQTELLPMKPVPSGAATGDRTSLIFSEAKEVLAPVLLGLGCSILAGFENWSFSLLVARHPGANTPVERAVLFGGAVLLASLIGAGLTLLLRRQPGGYGQEPSKYLTVTGILLASFFLFQTILTVCMLFLNNERQ